MDRPPEEEEEPRPSTSRALAPAVTFERLTCQILRLVCTQHSPLEIDAVQTMNWHTSVEVANRAVICAFQEMKSSRDALQLTDLNLKGHCSSTFRDSLRTDACNYANRRLSPGSQTSAMLVFALPVVRVPVTGIHLFRGRGNSQNRPPRANARTTIRRAQYTWTVKVNVSAITWTRKRDQYVEGGYTFTTDFTFLTGLIPLTLVDAIDQLACSNGETYVQKAETIGEENVILVSLVHFSLHPPTEVFLQLSVYAHRAEVMWRHNPNPFFERHSENGFLMKCPLNVTIPPHQTYVVQFNNALETQDTCLAVFFPLELPGISMDAGPLPNRTKITVNVQNLTANAITLAHMQMLGFIHLFRRGSVGVLPNKTETPRCSQIRLRAGLVPRDSILRGISEFAQQSNNSSSSEDEEEEGPPITPPIITEAIFDPFQTEDSSEDEDDEPQTTMDRLRRETQKAKREGTTPPMTHRERLPKTAMLLVVPSWNLYIHPDLLLPLTARIAEEAVKNTSYLRSELDGDICTAADLKTTLQALAQIPGRRSPSGRPQRPRI
ncbi:Cy110 [Cynomolgus cytomegalovirus]|uniref:Protein UL82 n=1 Tax=Cynomolgus macaque cytomegalovirus strain Mauritius TaxID=1690255 RepID=A0A0K1GZM7_9BETA|nr:Cy110 [Cynomolgus cytomegalovirus]AKT72668.1 protein UL82 [Cynomolgus macaque cytomegalovirus strain Mauritius]AXG21810.1 protein UL82 [synthetic construct]APT39284.1 Cy110 [Cynomolgus cytomegalovirus]APT39473.1 Cy110 [Cynomolgus cytomegalovirus]APT39668.1 Cy110 [Cynomolgus cytomegalovirus]